jgi:4-hydroxybenzoate polyprenyltransferase
MSWRTHLALGRVSNLPTVWSNVIAGAALAGVDPTLGGVAVAALAPSLFYVGGMYLNDAFDARFDRIHRPERPIPAGRITRAAVFAIGSALLLAGLVWLTFAAVVSSARAVALVPAWLLALAIVVYDARHKGNPAGPFVMGACRALVYPVGALAAGGSFTAGVAIGAVALFAYVVSLTFVAKRGGSSRTVGGLIAGIAVLDAVASAVAGSLAGAIACLGACVATLAWQRRVAGT